MRFMIEHPLYGDHVIEIYSFSLTSVICIVSAVLGKEVVIYPTETQSSLAYCSILLEGMHGLLLYVP